MLQRAHQPLVAWLWIAAALLALPASAHEPRKVGPKGEYQMVVGWIVEPAYVDSVNGVDIHLTRADGRAINTGKGDVVDLQVEVQFRASEEPTSAVVESVALNDQPKLAMNTENRYNAWFKPTRVGAYAFHIKGKISDAGDPKAGAVTIDETFLCGKGSKGHHGFVCLVAPQLFPAEKK